MPIIGREGVGDNACVCIMAGDLRLCASSEESHGATVSGAKTSGDNIHIRLV